MKRLVGFLFTWMMLFFALLILGDWVARHLGELAGVAYTVICCTIAAYLVARLDLDFQMEIDKQKEAT